MKKGVFFLTLDLEEWYHLDYFKDFNLKKEDQFIHELNEFFDVLDDYGIKITIFTLAEIAEKDPNLILNLSERGHEIACHGLDHELLTNKSNELFENQTIKAKNIIEAITNKKVIGYRASCFSMDREKLDILKKIGFVYDSSYIRFIQHSLYNELNLEGFTEVDNLIYKKDEFYEFELPTIKFYKYQLPISGGGYFRIFPRFIYNYFFKQFKLKNKNFNFYIHPFEVVEKKFIPGNIPFKYKLRYNIGRKGNLRKFKRFLNEIIKDYEFLTVKDYIEKIR